MLKRHLVENIISHGIRAGYSPGAISELLSQGGLIEDGLRNEDQMDEDGAIQIHSGISAYPRAGFIQDSHSDRIYRPDEARGRGLALLTAAYYVDDQDE